MATKKHMNYDSDEAMTLRGSKIPKAIMASEGTRFDSAEDASVFFARELDHVKAQSYDVEYPELTALHLFPQSSEADPGAETITYYTYDKTGLAKIIDNYSTDLPRADVTGKPSFAKIKSIGDSYGYSAQEMRASRLAGKSLDARKGESARYQIDALTNKIAWCGDEESGLMGVLADCVLSAGGEVIGVEPEFFMERAVQHTGLTRLIVTKDMSERKAKMIQLGQAFIAFPGGTGTLEEIAEIMSKVSLGQLDAPCILYNLDGYYNSLRALLDDMIEKGLSTPERQAGIKFARDLGEIRQILAEAESGR